MTSPVLRTRPSDTEGREAERHRAVRNPRLEQALPRLARVVSHLRFLVRLLQSFLRGVAHVVALVDIVHVSGIVAQLQRKVLRVLLRYQSSGWQKLFARDHLQARRLAASIPDVGSGSRDRTRCRLTAQFV